MNKYIISNCDKDSITYYQPRTVFVTELELNDFKIQNLKEIRLYTDNAQVRIYKPNLIAKINKQIKETNKLELLNLPKRIRNKTTNKIKVKFISEERNK